ncbi:hypothetical protein B0H10DRAFT_1854735 [Mycena sp. CBHHK59/15]|nr:hypothetical protein B0H10DRAFT_1854735 [Mycena sp. CBHHK59/15]
MLSVAVTYKEVINGFTGDWDLGYHKYDLSNAQWSLLEDMLHILKVFKDATLYFSNENHCTITQVLTTMDKIDDLITAIVVTSSVQPGGAPKCALHPSIKSVLKLAKATLNKYYSHSNTSNLIWILVLHPNYKLDYFRACKWEKAWIETAQTLVCDKFKTTYAGINSKNDDTGTDEIEAVSFHLERYS